MTAEQDFQLAQLNIALPLEPLTSARLAGFVELLEPVNALADRSPGFVWRLQTEDGDATAVRGFGDDRLIVNLTVWESLEALAAYVYGGFHAEVMRHRREWFTPCGRPTPSYGGCPSASVPASPTQSCGWAPSASTDPPRSPSPCGAPSPLPAESSNSAATTTGSALPDSAAGRTSTAMPDRCRGS